MEVLGDLSFSADVNIEATIRAPGLVVTGTGSGVVSGADSMLRVENDFSQLTHTVMDTDGNLLGPGALSSLVEESRVIDGDLFERAGDRRWILVDTRWPDTALGHVFRRLKGISRVEDLGVVVRDGVRLNHFRPTPLIDYDPAYFDLDQDELATFVAITDVYTDAVGLPLIIEIEFGLEHLTLGTQVWTETYRLDAVGSALQVERPAAWISARTLGFAFSAPRFPGPRRLAAGRIR